MRLAHFLLSFAVGVISVISSEYRTMFAQTDACARGCSINMSHIVRLTDAGHPGTLGTQAVYVATDKAGRHFVTTPDSSSLAVFNAKGRVDTVVKRAAGKEFGMVTNVLPADDGTVRVYDTMARTLYTLRADLSVATVTPFRYRPAFGLLLNRYVNVEQITTRDLVGYPLHLLDSSASILRSFGTGDQTYRADQPLRFDRVATPGSDGTVWSAPPGRYLLEQWKPESGTRLRRLEIPSRFKESVTWPGASDRPTPVIVALWEDDGYVWVLLQEADLKWKPAPANGERSLDFRERNRTYDSVLEAVSIATGKVVATRRFDDVLWGREPAFALASVHRSESGAATEVDLFRPRLVKKGAQ